MKGINSKNESITAPLLKDMIAQDKANTKVTQENASISSNPLDPPALYEDAGDGYNADFTFPQE
ncbi:MAG TPA: hypothetical protein VFA65_17310 [Bryobacteraceae bacterium]|nr:hypothetical protein [Bryobacteraceae bacterium]